MSTRRGEPPNIWIMDISGGNAVQLTSHETGTYNPGWVQDGTRVTYLSTRGEMKGLWSVGIITRRQELVLDFARARGRTKAEWPAGTLGELRMSPSMTRAAFSLLSRPAGRRVMYVADLEPFTPRALTDGTLSMGYPAWSPDERRIAVEIQDGRGTHAGVIDVKTRAVRQLTNERGHTWVRSWSPDGAKIAVAMFRDGSWSLQWIDADSGRQGAITPPGPPSVYVRYPDWSPRGDLVVFERAEMRGNIWMLTLR